MTLNSYKGEFSMDNLIFQRTWEDADFFEIEISAYTESVTAKSRYYVTEHMLEELSVALSMFPQNYQEILYWESGTKGDDSSSSVSFKVWCEDKLGHIALEMYMEFDTTTVASTYHSYFLLRTELGLLNSFGKSLALLNNRGIGKKVELIRQ
jgi:hypothetical protein